MPGVFPDDFVEEDHKLVHFFGFEDLSYLCSESPMNTLIDNSASSPAPRQSQIKRTLVIVRLELFDESLLYEFFDDDRDGWL